MATKAHEDFKESELGSYRDESCSHPIGGPPTWRLSSPIGPLKRGRTITALRLDPVEGGQNTDELGISQAHCPPLLSRISHQRTGALYSGTLGPGLAVAAKVVEDQPLGLVRTVLRRTGTGKRVTKEIPHSTAFVAGSILASH